jgi:hypothetical protein
MTDKQQEFLNDAIDTDKVSDCRGANVYAPTDT